MNDRSPSDRPPSDMGPKYIAPKYIALTDIAPKDKSAESSTLSHKQKILALYRAKPLLYGFFTLLAVTILMAGLSSLLSSGDSKYGESGGRRGVESQDATAQFVVRSLGRLDEKGHSRYTETLRNSLNQWMVERNLAKHEFTLLDARIVQGAVWMRDISNLLRRKIAATNKLGRVDELKLAAALFDWTMRNVTLYERDNDKPPNWELAWESLLWGRAKANSRAWIFIELCRQQQLEVAMLHYRDPDDPGDEKSPKYKTWIPALLLNKRGEEPKLYLFDHKLGLPIPGPNGQGIATLSQVINRLPEILRRLEIEDNKYPKKNDRLSVSQLKDIVAQLDELPSFDAGNRDRRIPLPSPWADRMEQLEGDMSEREPHINGMRLVLTIGKQRMERRFSDHKHLAVNISKPDSKGKTKQLSPPKKVFSWNWPYYCLVNYSEQEKTANEEYRKIMKSGDNSIRARLQIFSMPGFELKGQRNNEIMREFAKSFEELFQGQPVPDPKKQQVLASVARSQREKAVMGFLWTGRMLQFKGVYQDITSDADQLKRGAANVYQSGRVSKGKLDKIQAELEKDLKRYQKEIKALKSNVSEQIVQNLYNGEMSLRHQLARQPVIRFFRQIAHTHASYWIGIVAYERGDYQQAVEYFRLFRQRELKNLPQVKEELVGPRFKILADDLVKDWGPVWTNGARYNLARSLEAAGRYAEAIEIYQSDVSRQSHGSLLRARLLQKKLDRLEE